MQALEIKNQTKETIHLRLLAWRHVRLQCPRGLGKLQSWGLFVNHPGVCDSLVYVLRGVRSQHRGILPCCVRDRP